ncbi:MAG: response regulator [Candidatus Lernaella stagnicola]|nr:response regulator [Candidatus Lernaella stagnicola]
MPKRILVVDDDRNIGQILHASFSSKGYETIVSRNGEDALTKFEEVKPDLVLLDVLLPKMNGWEVCRKLKDTELGTQTPIILMSAVYKNYKMQQDAISKYGADDFVEKPFQLSKLLDLVEKLIGPGEPVAAVKADAAEGEEIEIEGDTVVSAAPPAPISMEGELSSISFAELLHNLYVMGKSGYLLVRRGEVEKEIAIKAGYPVSVRTTLEEEYFGNFLVRKRKISSEQRDESVERMKESKRLQGTILIEMDALTPHELVKYLKLQMREKIFEIFSWLEGLYKFTENDEVQGDITTLDMSTANVINEGVKDHYDLDRLLPLMEDWREKFLRPGANLHYRYQDTDFTRREETIFDVIDGTSTVDQIMPQLDLDTERAYQIIYTLVVCEMAELAPEPLEMPESIMERQTDVDIDIDAEFEMAGEKGGPPADESEPVAKASEASAEKAPPKTDAPIEPGEGGEAALRARVMRVFNRMSEGNYFQVLGVGDNPTEHEVRIAYHKIAKEFHPDRFFGKASEEVRARVEDIFRRATEAYEKLNTQEKIVKYKEHLESESEGPKTDARIEGVKKIIMAEQHFQNGKQYLKEKRYARSAWEFHKAMEISSNEAEYIAYYGWAIYNVPREEDINEEDAKLFEDQTPSDMQFNGREALNRAIQINPRSERAYLFLGAIYKMQGLREFAEKQYEKALICNPNCIEALRELRLIKLQEQKQTQKQTWFEKINPFARKK